MLYTRCRMQPTKQSVDTVLLYLYLRCLNHCYAGSVARCLRKRAPIKYAEDDDSGNDDNNSESDAASERSFGPGAADVSVNHSDRSSDDDQSDWSDGDALCGKWLAHIMYVQSRNVQ